MKFTKPLLSIMLSGIALQPNHTQCMDASYNFASNHPAIVRAAIGAALVAVGSLGCYVANTIYRRNLHWTEWKSEVDHVELEHMKVEGTPIVDIFPKNFNWGTALSSQQCEGEYKKGDIKASSQWDKFAREQRTLKTDDGQTKLVLPSGIACDFWNRYESDIALMKDIGANASRLSISWEKVCLQKPRLLEDGSIDPRDLNEDALSHYESVCEALTQKGIRPAFTLYHYAEPEWFYDMGGFEEAENIPYFVAFCKAVAQRLQKYNPLWFTFNAAEGHAAQGWLKGMKPPAKVNEFELMAQVLFNLLQAHVLVYKEIHKIDPNAQVGILKNIMQLDPDRIWHPLDNYAAKNGNRIQNGCVFDFFKTGDFNLNVLTKVSYSNSSPELKELIKKGNHALDFVGLNYYCHNYMHNMSTIPESDRTLEPKTNNPRYPIYGEGLYRAIKELSEQMAGPCGNLPIYVTENGVAADNNDEGNAIRKLHNKRYLYALAKAIKHGYNVVGYFHWAFMDNYEWGSYGKNYGIFEVDRDNNLERKPKSGAKFLIDLMGSRFKR